MQEGATGDGALARRAPHVWRLLAPLVRHRTLVLVAISVALALDPRQRGHGDWDFFVDGGRMLLGRPNATFHGAGGLHLFAAHPDLQIGAPSLLVVLGLSFLGPDQGYRVGVVLVSLVGPWLVRLLEGVARAAGVEADDGALALAGLLGGLLLVPVWVDLAAYGHVDDATTLAAATVAAWGVARRRPVVLGLAIGVAAAAKPWGVFLLPLAWAPGAGTARRALPWALGVVAVAWLPFVAADPHTLSAAGYHVLVADDSPLRVLGVDSYLAPSWMRPAQLALALVLASVAVARRRWPAVLLVAVCARIGLDAQTWSYYTAGLVLGALTWDLLVRRRALPLWTLLSFVLLADASVVVHDPFARAVYRLGVAAALVAAALVLPTRGAVPVPVE